MNEHTRKFMKHTVENGIHWPRKELSRGPGKVGSPKGMFQNAPKSHPTPRSAKMFRKRSQSS
jgi:hypothetical protein